MRASSLLISMLFYFKANELLLKHILHVTKIRPYTHFPPEHCLKLMGKKALFQKLR